MSPVSVHLGVSVGCFQLNKYGSSEIKVSDWAVAAITLVDEYNFFTLYIMERMYTGR